MEEKRAQSLKPVSVQKVVGTLKKADLIGYTVHGARGEVHVWYGHMLPAVREQRRNLLAEVLTSAGIIYEQNQNGDTLVCATVKGDGDFFGEWHNVIKQQGARIKEG